MDAARKVHQRLQSRRDAYLARFPRQEVDWAIQNARAIVQNMESMARITSRDRSMAENVGWILDQAPPGSKIALWAHNLHVSKRPGWMGAFLAERYGDDMVVLGFAFGQGRYSAIGPEGLRDYEALPPPPGSVESYLRAAGRPRFILDLRNVSGAPAAWLANPRPFRNIGALATRCAFDSTVVSNEYDGLIWLDRTNASVLLPFD